MIIKLTSHTTEEAIAAFIMQLENQNVTVHRTIDESATILALTGNIGALDENALNTQEIVAKIEPLREPYVEANRRFHPKDTVIELANGTKIGGGHFTLIAGPCSIESETQMIEVAKRVKAVGATILRGGAFKPRTSPYSFQGLGMDGLKLLLAAKEATGLPIISEIMDSAQLPYFEDVDIIQVGARNMQNFELLKHLGQINKPILLKRGLSSTYQELLMSAEYIMAGGNKQVILCERGIRTFETTTRNTLDISAIPILKTESHLPVIVDPSHAGGRRDLVAPLSLAAIAGGAHGLMIEVHNNPAKALCDGSQSLHPDDFAKLSGNIYAVRNTMEALHV